MKIKTKPIATILILTVLLIITINSALAAVVINEVMANSADETTGEYIELYNNGPNSVDLSTWSIDSDSLTDFTVANDWGTAGTTLSVGGYALIVDSQYAGQYNAYLTANANSANVIMITTPDTNIGTGGLTNTGDTITLSDNAGYSEAYTWSSDAGETFSWEKINPTAGDAAANWVRGILSGTPGVLNRAASNRAPTFTSTPSTSVNEDSVYNYAIVTTDADGDALTITAPTKPAWLTFTNTGAGTATLSGTPTNNNVGNNNVVLSVSDGITSTSQTVTINVINVNDAPTASNVVNNVNEDTEINITLSTNDIDAGDLITSCTLSNLNAGSITQACTCTAGVCRVGLTPTLNSNNNITANYLVNDGEANSNTVNITITVNPINDLPVVTAIPNQEAIEAKEFNYTVIATDVDNNISELYIDNARSILPAWLSIDSNNRLLLKGTPNYNDIGLNNYSIVVNDGANYSTPANFSMLVKPALEVTTNSIEIIVNDRIYHANDLVNVSPGDDVKVRFSFANNYYRDIGHIETEANVNTTGFANMPHRGVCEGVNCDNGYWVVNSGSSGTDNFTFQIPYEIQGDFSLNLKAESETLWYLLMFRPLQPWFTNFENLNFHLVRPENDIRILNSNVLDPNLTCSRTAVLNLTTVNTGQYSIIPELLIYDKEPVLSSFNMVTGEFTNFNGGNPIFFQQQTLNSLNSAETRTERINLDLVNLSKGEQTLYIYIVNPYFGSTDHYVGDSYQIKVNLSNCLNISALEQLLTLIRNSPNGVNADLRDYVIEDQPTAYTLGFSLFNQTNPQLINCSISGTQLSCPRPTTGMDGTSILTIQINEQNALSPLKENITATVTKTLDINNLRVNGVAINDQGRTNPLRPLEDMQTTFTVTNNLNRSVTGIVATLQLGQFAEVRSQPFNLVPQASQQLTLTQNLPYNLVSQDYPAKIIVAGRDYIDNTLIQNDAFNFILNLQQNSADIVISNLTLSDLNGITCKPSTNLNIEITNRGNNNENDVMIKILGSRLNLANPNAVTLNQNSKYTQTFTIPALNLSSGTNVLTAEVTYRDNSNRITRTINLNKNNCLNNFSPTDSNILLADGEQKQFSINLSETGFDNFITWYLNDNLVASGRNNYIFSSNVVGDYALRALVNANTEEIHTWNVKVSNLPLAANLQTNIPANSTDQQLAAFSNFVLENNFAKVSYNLPIDLTNIANLDQVVNFNIDSNGNAIVAVNSVTAPALNQPATITIKKSFNNYLIWRSSGFNTANYEPCPTSICTFINNGNGIFMFMVTGFSTYKVTEKEPAGLSVSEILIENVDRNSNVSTNFTIRNSATIDPITDLRTEIIGLGSDYHAQVSPLPTTLLPGQEVSANLNLNIPENEESGKHQIATLRFSARNGNNTITKDVPIYLNPKSYLKIDSIKINGKTSGKLTLEDSNEIEVKVSNDYTEDMQDLEITVKILDVDGDDLEETSDSFDLNNDDSETQSLTFDLDSEDISEDNYDIEVTVEGEADDNSEHQTTEIKNVNVEREKHKIIIKRAALTPNILECDRYSNLEVVVENTGENNEDNVELKAISTELKLDQKISNLELDKYSRSDTTETVRFDLSTNLENAPAKIYSIKAEVYLDGDLEDTLELPLEVRSCLTQQQSQQNNVELTQQNLSRELQLALLQRSQNQNNVIKTTSASSFRDSDTYLMLLGTLIVLGFIALVLALVLLVRGKRN